MKSNQFTKEGKKESRKLLGMDILLDYKSWMMNTLAMLPLMIHG